MSSFEEEPSLDDTVVTSHSVNIGGQSISYTATAGYIDVTEEDFAAPLWQSNATVGARIFVVSYVVPGKNRPVIFAYNGGPGAPSMWVHLGLFGPRRVIATDGVAPVHSPYRLVDNEDSPLPYADVVVIDLVNSGYSRAAKGSPVDGFHGVARDVDLTAEVIRRWVSDNGRWNSPIYLAGESYGVLRTIKVAERLVSVSGLYPEGLVLISSPIGPDSMDFSPGSVLAYAAFLPTYAAVAHYHGHRRQESLIEVLSEAQDYASSRYLEVLVQGNRLGDGPRREEARTLARITGLSEEYLMSVHLRVTNNQFMAQILRSRNQIVGRNDGRFIGWNANGVQETPHSDPSYDLIRGPFAAAANDYMRRDLGYVNDLLYEVTTRRAKPWPRSRLPGEDFTAVAELSALLRKHPLLRVSYHVGHYDLCTPYWGALTDVAQVDAPSHLLERITVHEYPSGHMIYLEEGSRRRMGKVLREFICPSPHPRTLQSHKTKPRSKY